MRNINQQKNKTDVLIIEDDPPTIELLNDFFAMKGYSSRGVKRGQKGLELAEKSGPKLILIDIFLPDIDGYEVCKKIRASPKLKDLKIVYITAKSEEEVSQKIQETGANGYILKPFELSKVEGLEKYLK